MKTTGFVLVVVWVMLLSTVGGGSAAWGQPAPGTGPAPLTACEKRFNALDTNHDGKLSVEEFTARPPAVQNMEAIFHKRDANGDGVLTKEEFCLGRGRGMAGSGRSAMVCEKRFNALDTNHDGEITLEEFSAMPHGPQNAEMVFNRRDANGDGFLTMDEFCAGRGGGRMNPPPADGDSLQ